MWLKEICNRCQRETCGHILPTAWDTDLFYAEIQAFVSWQDKALNVNGDCTCRMCTMYFPCVNAHQTQNELICSSVFITVFYWNLLVNSVLCTNVLLTGLTCTGCGRMDSHISQGHWHGCGGGSAAREVATVQADHLIFSRHHELVRW
jgi:hypothetical protein